MYSSSAVAARYSKALFEAALERGVLPKVTEDVAVLKKLLSDSDVVDFLRKSERQIGFFEYCGEALSSEGGYEFDEFSKNLLCLALENGRASLLNEVLDVFFELANRHENKEKIVIETAHPLTKQLEKKFIDKIKSDLGDKFYFEFKNRKELIGGYRIVFRSKVFDKSIRNNIDRLSRVIKL